MVANWPLGVILVLCNLPISVGLNLPADFTREKEGHAATDTPHTHRSMESSARDASIAHRFCMHQSASRPSSGRFTACQWLAAAIFLSHVGRGTHKTREPAWCLAHRAASRAFLGTYRRGLRRPAPAETPCAHDFQPQRRALLSALTPRQSAGQHRSVLLGTTPAR